MTTISGTLRGGVFRAADRAGYSPANHHGTTNVRLVDASVGARHMEILMGDIVRGGHAEPHAHPTLEQAAYVLEGEGVVTIDGVEEEVRAGDLMFFPESVYHALRVTSERIKLLVIYAPPYGENPALVVKPSPPQNEGQGHA